MLRHVLYCTGRWNKPVVERRRLEAPFDETWPPDRSSKGGAISVDTAFQEQVLASLVVVWRLQG